MVFERISTYESSYATSQVDYERNPTVLYKFIELKNWRSVLDRIESQPNEASTWLARHGKDGRLRWRILPLHAVICLKAPVNVLLEILKAYPDAASMEDDQGMLPIHLALKNDDVDDIFLRSLLKAYPQSMQRKDSKGRTPLEMKGSGLYNCWRIALDMERKKIRMLEKRHYEEALENERENTSSQIFQLTEELSKMSQDKIAKSQSENETKEDNTKLTQMQNINKEQKQMIDVQVKELATQGQLIKKLRTQIDVQEEQLKRLKSVEKTRGAEFLKLKDINNMQQKELAEKDLKIKQLEENIKSQENQIQNKKVASEGIRAEYSIQKGLIDDIQYKLTLTEEEAARKQERIQKLEEVLEKTQAESKKHKDEYDILFSQKDVYERKIRNLTVLNENYRKSLDEMTVVVNDSVMAMQKMTKERNNIVNDFFEQEPTTDTSNINP